MPNIVRRPRSLAAGIVSSVPIRPPRLNTFVARAFQPSTSVSVAARSRPLALAVACARPVDTIGMKALTPHQAMSAITAIANPLSVARRCAGVNSSAMRGWVLAAAACFQRSGSFTNMRTTNATAAGISPHRKTKRHDVSGEPWSSTPAIWKLTNVARNRPAGAEV